MMEDTLGKGLRVTYRLAFALVLGMALTLVGGGAHAQERPSLAVEPAELTIGLDDGPFSIDVVVDDVTNEQGLGGYTLVMSYDPAIVSALAVEDGGFVTGGDNAVVCPSTGIDNDAGRLAIFCFTIPLFSEPGVTTATPRVLATVQFEPLALGATTLDISEATLTDGRGGALASVSINGTVTVASAPPPDGNGTQDAGPTEANTNAEAEPDGTTVASGSGLPSAGAGSEAGGSGGPTALVWILAAGGAALAAFAAAGLWLHRRNE